MQNRNVRKSLEDTLEKTVYQILGLKRIIQKYLAEDVVM